MQEKELEQMIMKFNENFGKEYSAEINKGEKEQLDFVKRFPKSKLTEMTKEQYCIGRENSDVFCYWVERKTKELGSILGARADKFGLYYDANSGKYEATKKFSDGDSDPDPDRVMSKIRDSLIKLIDSGRDRNLKEISHNPLSPMFKGKILSLYYPNYYINVFSKESVEYFLKQLGIETPDLGSRTLEEKKELLIQWKNSNGIMKRNNADKWSPLIFSRFLYSQLKDKYGFILKLDFVHSGLNPDTYLDGYIKELMDGKRKEFNTRTDCMRGGKEKSGISKLILYDPYMRKITVKMDVTKVIRRDQDNPFKFGNVVDTSSVNILKEPIKLDLIESIPGLDNFSKKGFRSPIISEVQYLDIFGSANGPYEDEKIQDDLDNNLKDENLEDIKRELRAYSPEDTRYLEYQGKKIRRDQLTIARLKKIRGYRCQMCGASIKRRRDPPYVEGAHVMPKRDKGSEAPWNIIILCPNHHKEFDLGNRTITGHDQESVKFTLNGVEYEISLAI